MDPPADTVYSNEAAIGEEEEIPKENRNIPAKKAVEKSKLDVVARLGPSAPLRTLKEILKSHGKSDADNTMLLDPDHPLVLKFQRDLKEHLLKLHQETDEQIYDLKKAIADQAKSNDDIGKQSYALQVEIVHLKDGLKKLKEDQKQLVEDKEKSSKKLNSVKTKHHEFNETLKSERTKDLKLQKQVEDLSLQVVQLRELQLESYDDSSTMKRAFEKTTKQREEMEIEKLRQDMLINRLETEKHNFQDRINLYKSQTAIKKEELSGVRKVISAALSDIEKIHFEKLQLIQQWNYSISSLEKRDQTAAVMRGNIRNEEDHLRTIQMDITSHKKSVRKTLEENEKFTTLLLQRESDVMHTKQRIANCKERQRSLEEKYSFFDKVLQQTEADLTNLNIEKAHKEKELEEKSKHIESLFQAQKDLEDEHARLLHNKLTATKESKFNEKLIKELQKKNSDLQTEILKKEGEIAKMRLKLATGEGHIQSMEADLKQLERSQKSKEETIAKSESEIVKAQNLIERKQGYILELNKKFTTLLNEAGGQELGPLEREINNIKKEIANSEQTRKTLEQEWLRHQRDLVSQSNKAALHFKEIEILRKREAILEEQKIRIAADLVKEDKEIKETNRSIERIQNDTARLTALLHREKVAQEKLKGETDLLKGDFLNILKDAELEFVKKESEIENLRKKRSRLLQELSRAQHVIVLWEEKLQLAEETRKILKSESHVDEITNYKSEIRRLQFRSEQIKKEESSLIGMMQKAATQHANLYVKADFQCIRGVKKKSKQYLMTKTERLQKKIQEDRKSLSVLMEDVTAKNSQLFEMKKEKDKDVATLSKLMDETSCILNQLQIKEREKNQNIILLSYKYKRNRLLQQIKEDKYVWVKRSEEQRKQELQMLHENLLSLQNITKEIINEYPELKEKLIKVLDLIVVAMKL